MEANQSFSHSVFPGRELQGGESLNLFCAAFNCIIPFSCSQNWSILQQPQAVAESFSICPASAGHRADPKPGEPPLALELQPRLESDVQIFNLFTGYNSELS